MKRGTRQDWKKKSYNQKQRINYNEVFALINNIKGKLQEIEDV
jgi:hypothetical protein